MGNELNRRQSGSEIDAREEDVEAKVTTITINGLKVNGPMKYVLEFNVTPERDSVAWNQAFPKFIGMADIKAPLFQEDNRASMDIICVLDTSGSMSGPRISLLRKSVRRLVRGVKSNDRIALVEFSSNFKVLLDLTKMDLKGKDTAKKIVKNLRANGGTHLSGGLLEGMKIVKRRPLSTSNEVCSILLFTDGEANSGIRDTPGILAAVEQEAGLEKLGKALPSGDPEKWSVDDVCHWLEYKDLDLGDVLANVKAMKIDGQILMHDLTEDMLEEDLKVSRLHTSKFLREMEKLRQGEDENVEVPDALPLACTINTFGYGSGHNSDLLEKLAERFDGMYYYVKDVNSINEGFATCLGGLMSTVATNIQLNITPLNGAKNLRILNDFVVTSNNSIITANVGDIQSEEKRHILFEVDIPMLKAPIDKETYCSIKLSYDNTITSNKDILLSLLELNRGKVTNKRDPVVDEQYNRIVAGEALRKADEFGRLGQLEQARGMLDRAMGTVNTSNSSTTRMSRNLVNDMAETRKGYLTFDDYRKWGKNYTKQNVSCLRQERAVKLTDNHRQYLTQSTYMNVSKIHSVEQFADSCSDDSDEGESSMTTNRRAFSMRNKKPFQNGNKHANRFSLATLAKDTRTNASSQNAQYVNFQDFMRGLSKSEVKPSKLESPKGAQLAFSNIPLYQKSPDLEIGTRPTKEIKSPEESKDFVL